jgi:deazaflavin-dependent oxidoreductase (nitroreductase family)
MSRLAAGLRALGHRRWFAVLGRRLVPADRALGRLTRGRTVALRMGGLPSMLLTTTGRKTGLARTQPLLYAADGDGYAVIGSNWGQPHQPAWALNLVADPRAVVTLAGRRVPVRASLATGAERGRLLGLLLAMWPAYETYRQRAGERDLMVFRLAPAGGDLTTGATTMGEATTAARTTGATTAGGTPAG